MSIALGQPDAMPRRQRRVVSLAAGILIVLSTMASASVAAGRRWAVKPSTLVLSPTDFPGLAGAGVRLDTARSAVSWTIRVQGDSPKQSRQVAARLSREGFREGVMEYLTSSEEAIGASAGEVLGSPRTARSEALASVGELRRELGPGTTSFSVAGVPHALGLQQTSLSVFPDFGLFPTTVAFPVGRCVLSLLLAVKPSVTPASVEAETTTAALRLYHQVERRCT